MKLFRPKKIYVERSVVGLDTTLRIISKFPDIPVQYIDSLKEAVESIPVLNDPVTEGKSNLFIAQNKGSFVKRCPGTREYICCNYYVINLYNNCHMECSYCILQQYINSPFVTIYANTRDMLHELEQLLSENPKYFYRMGTGELGDSLALDSITEYSKKIIPFFAVQNNALLELKTKTGEVKNLLDIEHRGRTVVSWSVNPECVVAKEELKTDSLEQRIEAACLCQEAGYFLGFHFDPLIIYPGWEDDYRRVISIIYRHINPKKIMWISLGALRFPPDLKGVIRQRFPKNRLVTGELIQGIDGKMRYIKAIRKDIYSKMFSWINNHDPDPFVYLCMESSEIWERSMGWIPCNDSELDLRFQQRVNKLII